jgi:hypothetical protein
MSSSKKIDKLSDFAAGVYLSEAQNPPPPTHIVYVYTHTVYGKGGFLNQREV